MHMCAHLVTTGTPADEHVDAAELGDDGSYGALNLIRDCGIYWEPVSRTTRGSDRLAHLLEATPHMTVIQRVHVPPDSPITAR